MNQKIKGFVCWYDEAGDDGIIQDFEGNEYYFNSYSLPKTHYLVTGICKYTGKKKTIKTKLFPGRFLQRKHVKDPLSKILCYDFPVEFSQANGISQRWAVDVKHRPDLEDDVISHRMLNILESLRSNAGRTLDDGNFWEKHLTRQFDRLIQKAFGEEVTK